MIKWFLIILFLPGILSAQKIMDIFPSSAGDWNKRGSAEVYEADELFRLIDGGAVLFEEYGFNSAAVQEYTNSTGSTIEAEIYEMSDSASAFGIFSLTTLHTGKRINFINNASAGDGFIIFQKGKFYFSLSALEPGADAEKGLYELAHEMAISVAPAGKPALAERFGEIRESKIAYIRGNIGLYNLTTLNMGNTFRTGEGIYLEKDNSRSFIFKYRSSDESRRNYSISLIALENSKKYKQLKKGKAGVTLSDKGNYIKYFQYENYLILSISPARQAAEKSAEEIVKLFK